MKSWIKALLLLCFLNICAAKGFTEIKVSCVYNNNCILPCSYKYYTDVLHWIYIKRINDNVHSYYDNGDQFVDQDPRFKGRTSLVEDQVTGRKTSLMLKNVKVQDEGKYSCFISNDDYRPQVSYVVLQVDAPVQRVNIIITGNSITCSSEGIYPKPELTWSSSLQSNITVHQTEEKLYNIFSSLNLSDMDGDLPVSCTVSTRFNKRTSTLMKPIVTSTSRAQISCSHTNTFLKDSSLLWRFNHKHVIMRWNNSDGQHVSDQWKNHVEAEKGSDVLHLQNLSSDQQGTYSCEMFREEETTETHTLLRVNIKKEMMSHEITLIVGAAALSIFSPMIWMWILLKQIKEKQINKKRKKRSNVFINESTFSSSKPLTKSRRDPENLEFHSITFSGGKLCLSGSFDSYL